jgi:hypothetical protein
MNAPERSSAFILDEDSGEQKVTYSQDTKVNQEFVLVVQPFVVLSRFVNFFSHSKFPLFLCVCLFVCSARSLTQEHFALTRKIIPLEICFECNC